MNFTLQYLEKYSSTVQRLGYRGWPQVSREELLTGGGRGDGRWKSEGMSAIGDGRQAAISLLPDIDGAHICILKVHNLKFHIWGLTL